MKGLAIDRLVARPLRLALGLAALVTGCATTSDVLRAHEEGGGTTQTYATGYATAWSAARDVLRGESPTGLEEHPREHYLLATFADQGASTEGCTRGASLIGVWVESVDDAHVRVSAVSRLTDGSYVSCLSEAAFFEKLDRRVAGRPAVAK